MIFRGTRVKKELEFFTWTGKVCGEVHLYRGGILIVAQMDNGNIFCFQPGDKTVTVLRDDPAPIEMQTTAIPV